MQASDALFLPEGWWHQVDSAGVTIAVNFWWRSLFDRLLGGPMDAYLLRRATQSLTDARKAELLRQLSPQPPEQGPPPTATGGPPAARRAAGEELAACRAGGELSALRDEEGLAGRRAAEGGGSHGEAGESAGKMCDGSGKSGDLGEAEGGSRKRRQGMQHSEGEEDEEERIAVQIAAALSEEALQKPPSVQQAAPDPGHRNSSSGSLADTDSRRCCIQQHAS